MLHNLCLIPFCVQVIFLSHVFSSNCSGSVAMAPSFYTEQWRNSNWVASDIQTVRMNNNVIEMNPSPENWDVTVSLSILKRKLATSENNVNLTMTSSQSDASDGPHKEDITPPSRRRRVSFSPYVRTVILPAAAPLGPVPPRFLLSDYQYKFAL